MDITTFRVGDRVSRVTGERKPGRVKAVVIPIPRGPIKVVIEGDDGEQYEELAVRVAHTGGNHER